MANLWSQERVLAPWMAGGVVDERTPWEPKLTGACCLLNGTSSGSGRCEFIHVDVGVCIMYGDGWVYLGIKGGKGGEKKGEFQTHWQDGVTVLEKTQPGSTYRAPFILNSQT